MNVSYYVLVMINKVVYFINYLMFLNWFVCYVCIVVCEGNLCNVNGSELSNRRGINFLL